MGEEVLDEASFLFIGIRHFNTIKTPESPVVLVGREVLQFKWLHKIIHLQREGEWDDVVLVAEL